jgi:hypothetical protein
MNAMLRRGIATPSDIVPRVVRLRYSIRTTGVRGDTAGAGADGQTATSFNAP